jgi:pyruvate dehydrogenase E1 component
VDGDYQKYSVEPGSYTRRHFFGKYPELLELVNHLTDEQIRKLLRGGHDTRKVYAAYKAAMEHKGQPTVILAKTVKGYGLGEAGEGRNISHQQKKMNEKELREFRARFNIPISDDVIAETPFFRPRPDSPETKYLLERRKALGGFLPARIVNPGRRSTCRSSISSPIFQRLGTRSFDDDGVRAADERFAAAQGHGRNIVPIIPDEARTFGLDALFREIGIYSSKGQLYEPVDSSRCSIINEKKDGQILEEGITEAGSMASFIAAGTSYATHGVPMIPFYIYYSMFGPQRVGDLFWLAGDIRAKGLSARRDLRPHHAQRRRPATSGRPQPFRDSEKARIQVSSRRCL